MKILRIIGKNDLISAQIFEKHFRRAISSFAGLEYQVLLDFVNTIGVSNLKEISIGICKEKFFHSTRHFDFLCPSFEAVPFTPFFLYLRNISHSPVRLLLIAHSPGGWPLDWLLLKPLLKQGDIIVAPGKFARRTILFICPEIEPFIHIIHHPIFPLAHESEEAQRAVKKPPSKHTPVKLVTLSRIIESKLIHRQIEAVPHLIKAGYGNIHMAIAGSLKDENTNEYTLYARGLKEKIRRLDLEKHIELTGLLKTDYERSRLLARADLSINLSLTIEEAFPKASLEPLGLGIPVLATQWNGFEEIVGKAGLLLPLSEVGSGILDIDPKAIADGILHILHHPISEEVCRKQAQKFNVDKNIQAYFQALQNAMHYEPGKAAMGDPLKSVNHGIANTKGLLGKIGFLKPFSWKRMMQYHIEMVSHSLPYLKGEAKEIQITETFFRAFLLLAIQVPLTYYYAGRSTDKWLETFGDDQDIARDGNNLRQVMGKAILAESITTARNALLNSFFYRGDHELLDEALSLLKKEKIPIPDRPYYEAASAYLRGDFNFAYTTLSQSYNENSLTEYHGDILKLMARICRKWKKPELAAGILSNWLNRFPDSSSYAFVLLEYVYNRLSTAQIKSCEKSELEENIGQLKKLLGSNPVISKIEMLYDAQFRYTAN